MKQEVKIFSAMEDDDYTFPPTNLTFFRGSTDSTSECANISITDDTALEGDQTFTVMLTTSDPDVAVRNSMTTITIEDNDSKLTSRPLRMSDYCFLISTPYRCECVCARHVECGGGSRNGGGVCYTLCDKYARDRERVHCNTEQSR